MIIFELFTFCTALRWSKTGIPLTKAERKAVKAERREKLPEPCTVHYTPQQVLIAQEAGLNTSNWNVDSDSTPSQIERASDTFVDSWSNPDGFNSDYLRIPYRFKTENYDEKSMQKMTAWLDEISGYVDGCIEFYDDTNTKYYSQGYILIRNTDDYGNYDSGCSSRLGRVRYSKYQIINMGDRCISKSVMQHEMLHALGFNHEQQRPDRDQFVDILYENIQPYYRFAFDKLSVSSWDNYEQIYDFSSVMHYEGNYFLTKEAENAGKSSIVYKGTMDQVTINAEEMSSIDVVQLARRYSDFCKEPEQIPCSNDEKDGYFLLFKACDGNNDCKNGYDEGVEQCANRCGSHLYVEGLKSIEGDYFVFDQSVHRKLAYYNEKKKIYLYFHRPRWYFSTSLDMSRPKYIQSRSTWSLLGDWGPYCPIGHIYDIRNPKDRKDWINAPNILVTLADNRITTETFPLTTTTVPSITTPTIQRIRLI